MRETSSELMCLFVVALIRHYPSLSVTQDQSRAHVA